MLPARPGEVLEARIELWNRSTGEITFPRTKCEYNRWTRRHIPGAPRTMKLTGNTSEMLRLYVGNRKKGHIFINERTGKRLNLRHFEKMIDKWARLLNIRKTSVHQAQRPGVPSDLVDGSEGCRREVP
jgi:integrase